MGYDRGHSTARPVLQRSIWSKIGWFVALWAGSVLTLAIVAYGIRLMIHS